MQTFQMFISNDGRAKQKGVFRMYIEDYNPDTQYVWIVYNDNKKIVYNDNKTIVYEE